MTAKDVLKLAKEKGAKIVDLRFIDLPGLWQHFSIPVSELSEEIFEDGLGFDGSSIRGFQSIDESDMLLIPDPNTAVMDPFTAVPTLVVICNIKDPVTGKAYTRDPRYIAQKAEAYLKKTGLADTVFIGPELEFFFFDSIRFDQNYNSGYYFIDSEAGAWNTGKEGTPEQPNLGYKPRYKQGYFPVPPMDKFQDIRSDMVLALESVGVRVEVHHHEVATGGQTEIDMRFDTLTKMADKVLWYKYCAKNTARKWGKTATFMPKPLFQDNGSGMHTHQSLWKGGKNLFYERGGYADISKTCLYYIGGILKHAPAQGPVRAAAGRAEEDQAAPGRSVDRARQSREVARLAAQGRRVHARRHRDLDRVQAEERGRRGAAAPASVGVRALLRHLVFTRIGGAIAAPR